MKLQYERITVNYNYWLSVVVVGSVYSEAFGDVNLPHMTNVGLSEDALAILLEISFPLSWNESGAVQVKNQQQQSNKQKRKQKKHFVPDFTSLTEISYFQTHLWHDNDVINEAYIT